MADTADIFTTDVTLTDISIARGKNKWLADHVFPGYESAIKTGKISQKDANADLLRQRDVLRMPGSQAVVVTQDLSRPITYNAEDHAVIGYVPDEHKAQSNPAIQAAIDKTQDLTDVLNNVREIVAVSAINTSATANSVTSSPGTKWDATGGDAIADIIAKMKTVEEATGVSPNALALDGHTLRMIGQSASYQDQITSVMIPTISSIATNLAGMLGIPAENIQAVDIAMKNTAVQGQTKVISRIWDEDVFLFYKEDPRLEMQGFGVHAHWSNGDAANGDAGFEDGWRVEEFREAKRKSDGLLVSSYYEDLIINPESCWLFTNVLA